MEVFFVKIDENLLLKYTEELFAIPSTTGNTYKIMDYIRGKLKELHVDFITTNKGALIATIKGKSDEKQKTFSAHVDTLGAMVKGIKQNGALEFTLIGGYMANSLEGANCTIETMKGEYYEGTIQTIKPSVHISGDEARELKRTTANMEVILDEKVFSKEDVALLGIEVGDFIFVDTKFTITKNKFIKSRYLDDKASVAVLMYCIQFIKENNIVPETTTNFFISNYEEVGHGAKAALPEKTTEFISVDMGAPGVGQNSSEYAVCICAKDSSGPYDLELKKALVDLCEKNDIAYKIDIYPFYSSDASAAVNAGWDVRTALIGPGVFASHAYERTHIDSMTATAKLVLSYL